MGANTAELFFGIDISGVDLLGEDEEPEECDEEEEKEECDKAFNIKDINLTLKKLNLMAVEINEPYETEDHYIMIPESHFEVDNGGTPVGVELIPKRKWIQTLEKVMELLGITEGRPQYYLVGHYS